MLNIDWFQLYKHIASFSVGGVYLVLMNLPRSERFKKENVILVGIIPNMDHQPPTNSFIKPLVDELNEAWDNGFNLVSSITKKVESFHLALLCVGCDIPACRKLCGFLGKDHILLHDYHFLFNLQFIIPYNYTDFLFSMSCFCFILTFMLFIFSYQT